MLPDTLIWLKAKVEELLAEEQAGCRPGQSMVEQIFNSWVITEKHLQHQCNLIHNFIDFKKVLDKALPALADVLHDLNISALMTLLTSLYPLMYSVIQTAHLVTFAWWHHWYLCILTNVLCSPNIRLTFAWWHHWFLCILTNVLCDPTSSPCHLCLLTPLIPLYIDQCTL